MKCSSFAGLAAAVLAACGGTATEILPPPAVNVTGSWRGTIQVSAPAPSTFAVLLRANQVAGRVDATYVTDFSGTGNLTGTVEGNLLRFDLVATNPGCPGRMSGTGVVDATATPPTMEIAYRGSTCGGPASGAGVLTLEGGPATR
jgi:hypothetical protein